MPVAGADSGDWVAAVEGLVSRQYVVAQILEPGWAFAEIDDGIAGRGQVGAREYCLDAG